MKFEKKITKIRGQRQRARQDPGIEKRRREELPLPREFEKLLDLV